jgi:outer membrane protein assembly factor BamB
MMMHRLVAVVGCTLVSAAMALAQFGRGAGDFVTTGTDAHRSSWIRTDAKISKDRVQKPGEFTFLWKVKLNNQPTQATALSPLIVLDRYIGFRGFRSLGYVGGSSDGVFAFDTDLGKIEWQKRVSSAPAAKGGTATCPGGMTANLARPAITAFPTAGAGAPAGGGRGGPAKSGVGEPNQGAVTLANVRPPNPGPPPGAPRPGGGGPPRRVPNYIYALSSDGMFHQMYVSNGDEPEPAIQFLPAGAYAHGLTIVDEVAYASTSNSCGGAADGLWALDLTSKKVSSWKAGSGVAGSAGPAFAPDGTIYLATSKGDLVALAAKTLEVKRTYPAGQPLVSSPLLFQHKDKTLVAVAAKDGGIHVLDASSLQSPVARASVAGGADFNPGALASWQDGAGTRWILVPSARNVVALKMTDASSLQTGWSSGEMVSPMTPLVINGVVFALAGGSPRSPAVVSALDPATGQQIWTSGKTITSYVRSGGLSGGGSQVYVGTHDGTLYAFGFPIEH